MENNIVLINQIVSENVLKGTLSGVRKGIARTYQKVTLKPITLKGALCYHISYYEEPKVKHENIPADTLSAWLEDHIGHYFKQAVLYTEKQDYQLLISKKGKVTVIKHPPSMAAEEIALTHNRKKQYILEEGRPIDFLVKLGVMDENGRVFKKKYDKFRQLNKYLEFVDDAMHAFSNDGNDGERPLTIIDFGCGKAYLTFALYYYLVKRCDKHVKIIGLDLKEDVILFCNEIAEVLGYVGLRFEKGDIKDFQYQDAVDMVVSLHACDTATDAAIGKAVSWGAKVIFAVPCCQHELFNQIQNNDQRALLAHGVIKDKLITLITDTLRAQALEVVGYDVQMLEFIDLSHTPKNILIRAYAKEKCQEDIKEAVSAYLNLKQFWHVAPSIEKMLGKRLMMPLEKYI